MLAKAIFVEYQMKCASTSSNFVILLLVLSYFISFIIFKTIHYHYYLRLLIYFSVNLKVTIDDLPPA